MAYIDFIYGLAFFSLGLVIGLESFRPITPTVKPAFRNLAAFGLLYAVHQWIEFGLVVSGTASAPYSIVILDISIMVLAVVFLVRFSCLLFTDRRAVVAALPIGLLVLWLVLLAANISIIRNPEGFHTMADDLARYVLILPANLLATWGLLKGGLMDKLENGDIRADRIVLGSLFVLNALFSGILVAPASFIPARLINSNTFYDLTGVPVALAREAIAVGITVFMVRALRVFERTFIRERLAKEAMESDAKIAAEIQLGLVPKEPLHSGGTAICARLLPARFVGGDIFDYFASDGVITFMIGDASGKGSPAALLCTAGLVTLETELRSLDKPKDVLRQANRRLSKRFPVGSFMTAAMGRYLSSQKLVELASSGQNPPLIYRRQDRVWRLIDLPGSLPLGVEAGAEPTVAKIAVSDGDRLLCYTDGLIDVRTTKGKRIGFDAIVDWLNANLDLGPEELLNNLVDYLLDLAGGDLYDDVTVLLLEVGAGPGARAKDAA